MKIDIGKNGNKLVNILHSDKISYKKEKNNCDKYTITMWNDSLLEKWRNKLQNTFGHICSKFFTAIPIISDTMNNLNLYCH